MVPNFPTLNYLGGHLRKQMLNMSFNGFKGSHLWVEIGRFVFEDFLVVFVIMTQGGQKCNPWSGFELKSFHVENCCKTEEVA